jgi:hypothetical protein
MSRQDKHQINFVIENVKLVSSGKHTEAIGGKNILSLLLFSLSSTVKQCMNALRNSKLAMGSLKKEFN